MKKILIACAITATAFTACKKDYDRVSTEEVASRPTITFSGGQYYSINVGAAAPTVTATAFDSILKESYPVVITGTDNIDNTTPGLYTIIARSTNRLGFYSEENVYVAVTDVPATSDLSGEYKRTDVSTGGFVDVVKLARGLYQLDNLAGADRAARPDLLFPVTFVHSDDTTLLIPRQATAAVGTIAVRDSAGRADRASLRMVPGGDTTYKYAITAPSTVFGGAIRTFTKQ